MPNSTSDQSDPGVPQQRQVRGISASAHAGDDDEQHAGHGEHTGRCVMMPSSACARARRSPLRSACTFQNTPVMMLPRNSTTLTTCRDFSDQVEHRQLASRLSQAARPAALSSKSLSEDGVDGVVAQRAAVIAQACVRPGAQLEAHARQVVRPAARAMRTNSSMASYMSLASRAHSPDFAVVREIEPARPELHEPHDRGLELRRDRTAWAWWWA